MLAAARERGLLLYSGTGMADGTAGDAVLLGPPFVISREELETVVDRLAQALEAAVAATVAASRLKRSRRHVLRTDRPTADRAHGRRQRGDRRAGARGRRRQPLGRVRRPHRDRPSPHAVLILPDVRGLHPFYVSLAERFAEAGVDALAIDYFGRTAGVGHRDDDFPYMEHREQTTWPGLTADIEAGGRALAARAVGRSTPSASASAGGSAFSRPGCASPASPASSASTGSWATSSRFALPAPIEAVGGFGCPVLGLFGGADPAVPADQVDGVRRRAQARRRAPRAGHLPRRARTASSTARRPSTRRPRPTPGAGSLAFIGAPAVAAGRA